MNWEMFGAVGELVSAFGVIVSLVYVGYQVRQNTRMIHAASIDSTISSGNYVREQIVANADVASVYDKGNKDPARLTDEERVRYRILLQSILWTSWNAYAQTKLTGLEGSTFDAQKPFLRRVLYTPGGQWFWKTYQHESEAGFRAKIEEILRTPPTA